MTTDQSAFSILSTELHRIEQNCIQKWSCATVKNSRDSRHVTLAILSHEKTHATKLRDKIAGVTSVLDDEQDRQTVVTKCVTTPRTSVANIKRHRCEI